MRKAATLHIKKEKISGKGDITKEPALMGSCPFWFPAILAN